MSIKIVTISHIGLAGDGIAKLENGDTIYVTGALAGEKVSVNIESKNTSLIEIIEASSERQDPPCPYFGKCGGCIAQHMNESSYITWKKDIVAAALKRENIDTSIINEPIILPKQTRRRTNLKAQKLKGKFLFGYRAKGSHDIINIDNCLLLRQELVKLLAPLKRLVDEFLANKETADIWISITNNLIDLYIDLPKQKQLSYEQRETLADFAKRNNIAKFTLKIDGFEDPVFSSAMPTVAFNNVNVATSAKSFIQVSDEADKALTKHILSFLEPKNITKIADLFCGRGTFTFAFAEGIKVDGYEADKPALEALNNAAKSTKKDINGHFKNLFSYPLNSSELNDYDAVILDPPRDGAKTQIAEIANSNVANIIYISCNPKTFARDAKVLLEGSYKLQKITPVDQFLWSNHIELIALFTKN